MSNSIDYEIVLLAIMLWREARGEDYETKVCVAATVMNRVRMQGWPGKTVVDVVTKKWQYSSMSDPKDRQLTTWPELRSTSFNECLQIATAAVKGTLQYNREIDHYYDDSLKGDAVPDWAKKYPDRLVFKRGRLFFFNLEADPTTVVRTA